MTTAVYAGSFDPVTLGHIDIIERAAHLFEKVIIAVFDKPLKSLAFSPDARQMMMEMSVTHLTNVDIIQYNGLTVHLAKTVGAQVMIRGLRTTDDLARETQLSLANRSLDPEIDTICLIASQEFAYVSSSIVKEIAMNNGRVDHIVPAHVAIALKKIYVTR